MEKPSLLLKLLQRKSELEEALLCQYLPWRPFREGEKNKGEGIREQVIYAKDRTGELLPFEKNPNMIISDLTSGFPMLNICIYIFIALSLTDAVVVLQENTDTGSAVIYGA